MVKLCSVSMLLQQIRVALSSNTFTPLLGCDRARLEENPAINIFGFPYPVLEWPPSEGLCSSAPRMQLEFIQLCLCSVQVNDSCCDLEVSLPYFVSVRMRRWQRKEWRLVRVIEIEDDRGPLLSTDPDFGLPRLGRVCNSNDIVVFQDITNFIAHVLSI